MKRMLKKSVLLTLVLTLIFSLGAGGALAKGQKHGKQHNGSKHKMEMRDMKGHWAQGTVEKLVLLGVINGYSDQTFQPNKPVTRAEAVAMTIRILGWEDEAQDKMNARLPFKDARSIPAWAWGSVALALEEGLIEPSHVFQANKPATRLYVMTLMVNAIDAEFDGDLKAAKTYFKDIDNLSEEEKAALAYAVLLELVNGYEDGTFRPNKPVTRAEMAVLLERAKERFQEGTDDEDNSDAKVDGKGVITSINYSDRRITFDLYEDTSVGQDVYDTETYTVDDDAKIYVDGKAAAFKNLKVDMTFEYFVGDDDEIIYIDAKTEDEVNREGVYHGTITKVDLSDDKVWFKVGLVELPFILDDDVKIFDGLEKGDEDLIKVGAQATFYLNEAGQITRIIFTGTIEEDEDDDEDNNAEDLGLLEPVDRLDIEVDSSSLELNYEFAQDDDEYEANVQIKTGKNTFKFSGKVAVEAINDLLEKADIDLDADEIDLEDLADYIVDKYDLEEAEIDITIVVDGEKFELETTVDEDDNE